MQGRRSRRSCELAPFGATIECEILLFMDEGTAALWAASLAAGTSLIALWVNARSTRRQLKMQREDAYEQRRASEQELAKKSQEVREQRDYYERQIAELLEAVRSYFTQQQLGAEKVAAYKDFSLWLFSTFYDWLFRDGEWTEELQKEAASGPPPEIIAPFAVFAPVEILDLFEDLRLNFKYVDAGQDRFRDIVRAIATDLGRGYPVATHESQIWR